MKYPYYPDLKVSDRTVKERVIDAKLSLAAFAKQQGRPDNTLEEFVADWIADVMHLLVAMGEDPVSVMEAAHRKACSNFAAESSLGLHEGPKPPVLCETPIILSFVIP